MVLTEEMIKNLPLITDEELAEIMVSKEELIETAIQKFNEEADKIGREFECNKFK
ncbi:MAG: hypothetical protein ACI4T9_10655 [Prevotella sp.]